MRLSDEIRIIDLLTQREAEYLRVHQCEERIRALLGPDTPFPFPPPPSPLASSGRISAKRAWQPGKPVRSGHRETPAPSAGNCTVAVRDLVAPQENAYCIGYVDNGTPKTGFLNTLASLRALLELDCGTFRINTIDTIAFRSNEDYDVVARIFERI